MGMAGMAPEHVLLRMTADEIRFLPAGDTLDQLVNKCCVLGISKRWRRRIRPSQDANDAMLFLGQLVPNTGAHVVLTDLGWEVSFCKGDPEESVVVGDVSQLPLAICRAALLHMFLLARYLREKDLTAMSMPEG